MKRILAIVLSLALVLSVAAIASISVSAAVDSNVWCYVGKDTDASLNGNQYTGDDATTALQAALDDTTSGSQNTSANNTYLVLNRDITITKQLNYTGANGKLRLLLNGHSITYVPEDTENATTALNMNGYALWLIGCTASNEKKNFVAYGDNAFFENVDFQARGYINGDLHIKNTVALGLLGEKNLYVTGDLILEGSCPLETLGNADKASSPRAYVSGNFDYSNVNEDNKESITNNVVPYCIVTGETISGITEEVPTEPQTVYLDAYTATLSNCDKATDHDGYDGAGFVGNFSKADSSTITFASKYVVPATYTLDIRYAAPLGNGVVEVFDNGTPIGTVTLKKNVSINSSCQWCYFADNQSTTYTVTGDTEKHSFKLVFKSGSAANIDSLILIPSKPTITMDTGAAMRIDGTTEGIRFSAVANKAELDAFKNTGVTITDCGMIIAKQDADGAAEQNMIVEFAKESTAESIASKPNSVVAKYGNITPVSVEDANAYSLVGSLVKIKDANAKQMYVARAYIEYTVSGDSTKHYIYSDISEARSLAQVAYNIKNNINAADSTYYANLCDKHRAIVDTWAAKYITE